MIFLPWVLCAVALSLTFGQAQAAAPHWHLANTVKLGPPDDWDFVYLDPAGARVYVAHQDRVSVVDAKANKLLGTLQPIRGAHDIALVPEEGHLYADNGDSGIVSVFDAKSWKPLGQIRAQLDSDAMEYDAQTGMLIVANGDSGTATLIDPTTNKRVAETSIGPGAEGIATDGYGHAYINISDGGAMVRLDLRTHAVDARWPLKGCESPHGPAIDKANGRLFVTCRNRTMLVVNAANGRTVAHLPIGRGSDSAAYDPMRRMAFSANKDGTLLVIAEGGNDRYYTLASIKTVPGAATIAEDPVTGRIYVVAADLAKILQPHHHGEVPEYAFKPGTVKLLIFEFSR